MNSIAPKIFKLITSTSEKLSEKYFPDLSYDENMFVKYEDKFGEDGYIKAYYFEYICLIYAHISSILFVKHPDKSLQISKELILLLNKHFSERLSILNDEYDYLNILLSRTIQYDQNEDLKTLALNIQKREYFFQGIYIPKKPKELLINNSQLFYFWLIDPLSKDTPSKFDLNETQMEDYKDFIDSYVGQIIPLGKELMEVLNES
jgi:hypothetical protein